MTTELRKTGIGVVGDMPWGTHFCYFYETKEDLLDILIPYFKTGLENNEFCLWIISNSELLTVQEATSALREALPDLDRYLAEQSIEVVSHDEWFIEGDAFDLHRVANRFKEKLDEALARGYDGMRVNGSPAWLYKKDGKELGEFEEEVNKLFPNERMIASCTYPLERSGAAEFLDAARTHQFAIARRRGKWEVVETPELKQAKAEIKRLNEELEQRVVERTRELAAANEELRREISERKVVEEALKESQRRLEEAQRLAHVGSWNWDLQSNTLSWSDELYRIFGVDPQAFTPAYEEFVTEFVHAEDQALVRGIIERSLKTQEPFSFYNRILRPDGEERVMYARGDIVSDEHGKPIRMFGTAQDVTERKRAEEQLKATSAQLRALSARLQSVREEEGTRIAREIHDELGSALMSLKWDLEEMDKALSDSENRTRLPSLQEKIEAMTRLIDATINTVRRISSELRPSVLDDLGLAEAIEWQAQQFQARTGIVCRCDCSSEDVILSQEQSTAVFRILQEALTNVLRHAQATEVDITVKREANEVVLMVVDNGRGITEDEKTGRLSLGLLGMRERAHLVGGRFDINGVEGEGTVVTVRVSIHG
jgi:PAS domain S-box-containing protein